MQKTAGTKIYILGASGFLGQNAVRHFAECGHHVFTERVDITDLPALTKTFQKVRPDAVLNFAGARTEPNIDWCEDHKEETVRVNVTGAINAVTAALAAGAYPIQISSGCIYSGGPETPFTEEDEPNFYGSFYSRMRIVLQKAIAELPVLCVRIRMPLSSVPHPRNLINKMISYTKVISVPNSVTLIEDLFPAMERLIALKPTGILNLTNDGYSEHKDILETYKKVVDLRHTYELISIAELERDLVKAKRSNCVLSTEKAKRLGISMPALTEKRLGAIMEQYKHNLSSYV
ncbi:MAG: sugar nucleotide-binding protein [Patescibacteria group bacterium]